ncbi:hypothetical protein GJAV_G00112340 [Gymnothorax javanicus]|nr:hypothetical protein GJAV_G00112340 [Gymnothorax javanicus]
MHAAIHYHKNSQYRPPIYMWFTGIQVSGSVSRGQTLPRSAGGEEEGSQDRLTRDRGEGCVHHHRERQ